MSGVISSPSNAIGVKGVTASQLESWNSSLLPSTFIRGQNYETGTTIPKAYINYIFLDEQFRYVGGGASRVGNYGEVKQHWSELSNLAVQKNGYLLVYVSNESNFTVYFDNLQVVHKPGPIVEETHYYPFGLVMNGISSKAAGSLENKRKYNGNELQNKEFSDGSGLETYDFGWRMYDPQIGRFFTQDAYAEKYDYLTPYHYAGNNPANYIEVAGDSIFIHWNSKNALQVWEAIGNLLKTEDGKKLWNEYAISTENDIYIGLNTFKSKDDEGKSSDAVASTAKNVTVKDGRIDFSNASEKAKENASIFNGHNVSRSKGRTVSLITLNEKYWTGSSKLSNNELSEALYHEIYAHIKSTKISGYEQHKEYGNFYSGLKIYYPKVTKTDKSGNWPVQVAVQEEWKVPKGSPYYRIREQLLQIKNVKKGK
jgi:RHS repeat-associated protein